jgi:hypothetical protein
VLQLSSGVQLVTGILLLATRFVPLAPVVVNIFLFHVFLAPAGLVVDVVVVLLEVGLAWAHRDAFRGVLRATRA